MSRTAIRKVHSEEIPKRTTEDSEYTIPDGKRLRIDRFIGCHEATDKEARVVLLLVDGETETTIAVAYGSGGSYVIDEEYHGDGSKKIVIRLLNQDVGALHMTGIWSGVLDG